MQVRLTQTVQKGGCAAKISAEVLREALSKVDFSSTDPNVLVDGRFFDDAGIYKISDELALVQTLDFFTPIVDSPFLFGQIAAANALSDVYAMGGTPKTAMAILAFPLATLDPSIMTDVLSGAQNKVREAGASLIGGHSIDDDTLKFGLSVTGVVNPKNMWTNSTAKAGDHLILTKPIGTGTLMAGLKNSDYTEENIQDALQSMAKLNHVLPLLEGSEALAIHAATDITGFGLLGHSMQFALASKVRFRLQFSQIPVFNRAIESLREQNLTKAHRSNAQYTDGKVIFSCELTNEERLLLVDPQTSGGLLLSVAPEMSDRVLFKLKNVFQSASLVGEVVDQSVTPLEIF